MKRIIILNRKLENKDSLVDHVLGYYIDAGNVNCPNLNVPVFDVKKQSRTNTRVLINYFGSMMWINVRPEKVLVGNRFRMAAMEIQRRLENIRSFSFRCEN